MTANPAGDPARARDLTRLRELTKPHPPNPGAPIQQALPAWGRPTSPRSRLLGRISAPVPTVPA